MKTPPSDRVTALAKPVPVGVRETSAARLRGRHDLSRSQSRSSAPTPLPLRDWLGNFRAGSRSMLDQVPAPPSIGSFLSWCGSLLRERLMPRSQDSKHAAHKLRLLFEGLGGLWVPFCQLLSRQTVGFSAEFCEEMKQARYPAVRFGSEEARRIIEEQLNAPLDRVFLEFDEKPLGAIPYAQIYRAAVLRRGRVSTVIVRVLEPGARERLAANMGSIRRVVHMLKTFGFLPASYVGEMLDELDATRIELTDYRFELAHLKRLRRLLRSHKIDVMRVHRSLSGTEVLTTEYIAAPSLADVREAQQDDPEGVKRWCEANQISLKKVGRRVLDSYLRQLCEEPEFDRHFPPHHLLLLRKSRIALVGVRSVRSLHRSFRITYAMFLRSMMLGDAAKATDCLFLLCDSLPPVELAEVKREVAAILRQYSARVRLQPSAAKEKSLCMHFIDIFKVLQRHQIYVCWQFFDVQLGWSKLDESLRLTIPEENMLKRIRAYFEEARRREWDQTRRRGFSANAANLSARLGEFGTFHAMDLRRSARVFQAVVGKGAFVFAGFLNSLKWVAGAVGVFAVALFVNQYFPELLPDTIASGLTDASERIGRLPFGTWLVAIGAVSVIIIALARFRRKFLVPEPVETRTRR